MSTSKEYHDYVMENLRLACNASSRHMMGGYIIYYNGKIAGTICNNCLFVKITPASEKLLPDAERAYPYEGSKTLMLAVDDVENHSLMAQLLEGISSELPEPKAKKRKQTI